MKDSNRINDLLLTGPRETAHPVWPVARAALENFLTEQTGSVSRWLRANNFRADVGEVHLVPDGEGGIRAAVLGLGADDDALVYGALASRLPAGEWRIDTMLTTALANRAVLGFLLGAYHYDAYRAPKGPRPRLVVPPQCTREDVQNVARAVWLARDLINAPANIMGPADLETAARGVASAYGAHIAVTSGSALEAGFPLVHAVGAASARAPRLIDITHGRADAPKITLVGKGVCFDSGGLDLKPASAMALMKKDMGGAAAALGLAEMILSANLSVRLRVIIPAVENSVSGQAFRPGDVFTSRKGLTVEISNTDAEGRLILADALALADEDTPDLLLDFATLTGAARTALGPDIVPFYTDDDALAGTLMNASEQEADPLWRMPLWRSYNSMLDSRIADTNHVSDSPFAGSIIAALFLRKFVERAKSWAHFDIYAWNPKARLGRPLGGEAQVIRALFALLKTRYA